MKHFEMTLSGITIINCFESSLVSEYVKEGPDFDKVNWQVCSTEMSQLVREFLICNSSCGNIFIATLSFVSFSQCWTLCFIKIHDINNIQRIFRCYILHLLLR